MLGQAILGMWNVGPRGVEGVDGQSSCFPHMTPGFRMGFCLLEYFRRKITTFTVLCLIQEAPGSGGQDLCLSSCSVTRRVARTGQRTTHGPPTVTLHSPRASPDFVSVQLEALREERGTITSSCVCLVLGSERHEPSNSRAPSEDASPGLRLVPPTASFSCFLGSMTRHSIYP